MFKKYHEDEIMGSVAIVIAFILAVIIILCAFPVFGQEIDYTDIEIVEAIYRAEGADLATYPYGIRSVNCEGLAECRQVCFNSVRNARKRWVKASKPEDFIVFMGRRYCPPKAHPLNSNWVKNIKYFLKKNKE